MTHFKMMKKILLISILVSASPAFSDDQELIDGIVTDASLNAVAYKEIIEHLESGSINKAKASACGWLDNRLFILNKFKDKASKHVKVTAEKALTDIINTKNACNHIEARSSVE